MKDLAAKVILLWGWRRALAAFLAGALMVLAQAPFDLFAVCFVSFPVLVWLLDGAVGEPSAGVLRRLVPAFATGWWFGFGYFVTGLWWIGNALLVEAESFAWALPLAILALPAGLALFYGIAAVLARIIWSDGIGRIAALAFGFGAAEWLRTVVLTGFPWNAIGYAAMPVPVLMQSVSVVGLFGINALAVFVFAMPALLAARRDLRSGLVVAVLLIVAHMGFGYARLASFDPGDGRTLPVRIVQPSIDQTEKWEANVQERIFKTYLDLSTGPVEAGRKRPELIVWPETALPFLLAERPEALVAFSDMLDKGQVLLAGAVRAEGVLSDSTARFYNSVTAINDAGEIVDAGDKVHLVPFGEYLPFEDYLATLGLRKIVAFPQSFSSGNSRRPIVLPDGLRVLALVCYEIIFPGEIGQDAVEADLIVNVTNDAWYGDTPGPYQHFRQAQVRAVETGLPLVRAGNNGISAVVDAHGRVVDAFALNAVGVLDASVPLKRTDLVSPHIRYVNGVLIILFFAAVAGLYNLTGRSRPN
jgi:apolipoprotein N-acyltransferase